MKRKSIAMPLTLIGLLLAGWWGAQPSRLVSAQQNSHATLRTPAKHNALFGRLASQGSNLFALSHVGVSSSFYMAATLYVDDTLVITNDVGPAGLSAGDTVTFAFGEPGQTTGLTFGTNAFDTIGGAVTVASSGDTILVASGTYNTPQVLINKSLTLMGAGAATTFINGGNTPVASAGLVRIDLPDTDTGNVLFSGFTITNPGLTGSSRYHMFAKPLSPLSTITISNNKLAGVNASDYGIYSDRPRGTVVFAHNELTNMGFNPILIEHAFGSTDFHHNTISGNGSTAYFNFTYSANDVTTLQRVADNLITASTASAISFNSAFGGSTGKFTNVEITNNVITQLGGGTNRTGISLFNAAGTGNGPAGAIENSIISGNSITGIDTVTSIGIRVRGQVTNANIKSNNVRNVDRAVLGEVVNSHFPTGTQMHYNNFVSNLSGFVWNVAAAVNAENNWWGCNFGPGTGGVGCSGTPTAVSGTGAANVDANPWLTLTLLAMPTTLSFGGNAALTAKMTINSAGTDTAPTLCYVPNGTTVGFGGTLGTVAPPTATTINGTANATFTAGGAPGMGSATSTVDGQTVSQTITITCVTLTLTPPTLPSGMAGTAYSQMLTANPPGGAPYTFAHTNGTLPPGLTLSGMGLLNGTPTAVGTFNFEITITGYSGQCSTPVLLSLTIVCPTITLTTLPNGVQGTAYNQSVTASPTGGNYTYAVTTNVLPPGLTLNPATGAITGTPTTAGNFTFGITATGFASGQGNCSKSQSYNVLITGTCATITLNPATLPSGSLGTAYPATSISATGGVAPYTFAVAQGTLPTGLALDANSGAITGTPTVASTFSFRVTATGQGGCAGSRGYVVSVMCSPLTFSPATLPNGALGVAYNQAITVTPGTGHSFSVLLGSLPPGFTLNSAGVLSGLTNQTGTWTFTVRALAGSCQATKQYTLTIPNTVSMTALAQLNDYDGDAKSDLGLFTASGEWRIQRSSDQKAQIVSWGTAGDVPVSGDYDGDGRTDIAIFRPSDGTWYILQSGRSGAGGMLIKAWGVSTDVPVPGDYDGDGKTDIAVWRGAEGNWYILRSSDQQFEIVNWGLSRAPFNDVPVAGDYDGDGKTDVGVFRRATGIWYVRQSSNGNLLLKQWGLGTDVPVAQDYDGDGKVDLAVWRGSNGTWYIQTSATGAARMQAWGAGFAPYNDQAVPGDYDGDGQADLAVWRVGDASWYLSLSGVARASAARVVKLGESGDKPIGARQQ